MMISRLSWALRDVASGTSTVHAASGKLGHPGLSLEQGVWNVMNLSEHDKKRTEVEGTMSSKQRFVLHEESQGGAGQGCRTL